MDTSQLDSAQYIRLTTFRKNGSPRPTPVWVLGSGGTYEVTTSADAWKVKRLRNNPTVEVAACDARGRLAGGATIYTGTARVVVGDGALDIRQRVIAKYGLLGKLIALRGTFGEVFLRKPAPEMVGIVITIDVTKDPSATT